MWLALNVQIYLNLVNVYLSFIHVCNVGDLSLLVRSFVVISASAHGVLQPCNWFDASSSSF